MMLKHSILKCCPAFLIFFTLLAIPSADAQLSNQAQAQISQEAASLANEPAMLAVTPLAQGTAVGKKSEVQISLLNADNRPVAAKSDSQYEVTLQSSSGSLSSQKVWIKKGESSTHFQFVPDAAGLTLLRDAADAMRLSARGYHRVLRVARTLADLDGADMVGRVHLAEALSYRALADEARRAA